MFGSLPQPAFVSCPHCGALVARGNEGEHECDATERASYQVLQLRIEADRFDHELTSWLASPAGRFAVFYAERQRLRAA